MRGFTIIELLVTISIMLLLTGGGIAAFITFNDKQIVVNAAKELQTYLRSAQTRARVGDKPEACDRLNSYQVVTTDQGLSVGVSLSANCDNGDYEHASYTLPPGVDLTSQIDMRFLVLKGGVVGAQLVELTSDTRTYQFEVTQSGEMSVGGFTE